MVGARVPQFDESALEIELDRLEASLQHSGIGMDGMKQAQAEAVAGLACAVFGAADLSQLLDVLWSGAAPAWAGPDASEAERFGWLIGLLTEAVVSRLSGSAGALVTAQDRQKLLDVAQTLSRVDKLAVPYQRLSEVLVGVAPAGNKDQLARHP